MFEKIEGLVTELMKSWIENLNLQNKKLTNEMNNNSGSEAMRVVLGLLEKRINEAAQNIAEQESKKKVVRRKKQPAIKTTIRRVKTRKSKNEPISDEDVKMKFDADKEWCTLRSFHEKLDRGTRLYISQLARKGRIPCRVLRDGNNGERLYRAEQINGVLDGKLSFRDVVDDGLRCIGLYTINEAAKMVHPINGRKSQCIQHTLNCLRRAVAAGVIPVVVIDQRQFVSINNLRKFAENSRRYYRQHSKLRAIKEATRTSWCFCPIELVAWRVFCRYEILTEGMTETEGKLIRDAIVDSGANYRIRGQKFYVDARQVDQIIKNMQPTKED